MNRQEQEIARKKLIRLNKPKKNGPIWGHTGLQKKAGAFKRFELAEFIKKDKP